VPKCIRMEGMQLFDRITWNPNQMNGQPCIRGMRLTVRRVVESVAIYPNRHDPFRNYPELEPADVRQALRLRPPTLRTAQRKPNWVRRRGTRSIKTETGHEPRTLRNAALLITSAQQRN
jgi:uncharacterized protein (DUF433 family)